MAAAQTALMVSKFRHSCLLIELGEVRILLDPGGFSAGFESLTELSAVLFTHQHPDHLDADRLLALLETNPQAGVFADVASAAQLAERGVSAQAVKPGDDFSVADTSIAVYGGKHADIAPGIPAPLRTSVMRSTAASRMSGDAYTPPPEPVQVLAIPTAAPWLRCSDTVAFLQALSHAVVVPVHEAVLSDAGTNVSYGLYRRFADEQGTAFRVIDEQRSSF